MYILDFRRFIVLMGLTLTLLVGSFTAPVFAQGTPAQKEAATVVPRREPNDFALNGSDIRINYSTTSFIGQPQFNYKTQNNSRQFTGEEINTIDTNIGKLVTVLIEPDADTGKEVWLTLLLPTINLPSSLENSIQTEAILTTKRTLVRGGSRILEGQLETYKTLSLRGTARSVDF